MSTYEYQGDREDPMQEGTLTCIMGGSGGPYILKPRVPVGPGSTTGSTVR